MLLRASRVSKPSQPANLTEPRERWRSAMSLISVGSRRNRPAFAVLSLFLLSPAIIFWSGAYSSRSEAVAASQRVLFSTYLGGQDTQASGIALDSYGDAYVTGITRSAAFPLTTPRSIGTPLPCVFVTKIDPATGSII